MNAIRQAAEEMVVDQAEDVRIVVLPRGWVAVGHYVADGDQVQLAAPR